MGGLVLDNSRWQALYDRPTDRIIGRLKAGTDLFTGIKEVCYYFGVKGGQFQCLGSLKQATYVQVQRGEKKGTIVYSPKRQTISPVELISGLGFIGIDLETNDLDIHFHGSFVDCDQNFSGGHFLEGENEIAITVEFILYPLKEAIPKRRKDDQFGVLIFHFEE